MSRADALKAELDAGHPVTGAYDLDSGIASDQINEPNREKIVPLSSPALIAWASAGNAGQDPPAIKLQDYLGNEANPAAVRGLAWGALKMLDNPSASLDLNLADRQLMLAGLVAGGALSEEDKASIEAASKVPISRAEELGLGRIMPGTIQQVRPDIVEEVLPEPEPGMEPDPPVDPETV